VSTEHRDELKIRDNGVQLARISLINSN